MTIRCDFSLPNLLGFIPRWPDVSVRAICDQGSVELFNYPGPVIFHTIKVFPAGRTARTEKAYKFSPDSGLKGEEWWSTYRYQLEAFVDQVKGRAPDSWMTSEDSVANMEWIEKIYEAVCISRFGVAIPDWKPCVERFGVSSTIFFPAPVCCMKDNVLDRVSSTFCIVNVSLSCSLREPSVQRSLLDHAMYL